MAKHNFPKTLYVHEPLDPRKDPWDAYETYHDAEQDDTVGVYELQAVKRVKHEKLVTLVNEVEK